MVDVAHKFEATKEGKNDKLKKVPLWLPLPKLLTLIARFHQTFFFIQLFTLHTTNENYVRALRKNIVDLLLSYVWNNRVA